MHALELIHPQRGKASLRRLLPHGGRLYQESAEGVEKAFRKARVAPITSRAAVFAALFSALLFPFLD